MPEFECPNWYTSLPNNLNTSLIGAMQCDMKTLNGSHWCHSGVLIVDFEHISHIGLVFLLLTLNKELPAGNIFLLYATIIYVFCNIGSNIVIHNYKSVFFDHESNPSECLIPLNFFHFSHFKSTPPPPPCPTSHSFHSLFYK